jgi:hypothetical protein
MPRHVRRVIAGAKLRRVGGAHTATSLPTSDGDDDMRM